MERKAGAYDLLGLLLGQWVSQAICVAAELKIADLLSDGPRSAAEIAEMTRTSEDSVFRLLRALASLGLFSSLPDRRFALTGFGNYLRSDYPGSVRAFARFIGHDLTWRPWGELLFSVRTGQPAFNYVFGKDMFQYLSADADAAAIFNEAMTATSGIDADYIAKACTFDKCKTLVEIGGGNGLLLSTLLKRNTHLRGILLELPHAIDGANSLFEKEGIQNRCSAVAGDFLKEVPAGGDVYVMKRVIHDFDDELSCRILANCHNAMNPSARLLVIERVIAKGDGTDRNKFIDLEMLIMTPGGRERSEADFRALYAKTGFAFDKIIPTTSPFSIVEGTRI